MLRVIGQGNDTHESRDFLHLRLPEAAGGDSGRAHSDAAGDKGRLRIGGNRILVDGDAHLVETMLHLLAGYVKRTEVNKHKVVISAARHDVEAVFLKRSAERLCVFEYLLLIFPEFGFQSFAEGDCLRSNDMHERTALHAREYCLVDRLGVLFSAHDNAAAGTAAQVL